MKKTTKKDKTLKIALSHFKKQKENKKQNRSSSTILGSLFFIFFLFSFLFFYVFFNPWGQPWGPLEAEGRPLKEKQRKSQEQKT